METLRSQATSSALDQDRVVLVYLEAMEEDFGQDIEEALQQFSAQSLATVRPSRNELTVVFCCIADAIAFSLDCLTSDIGSSIRLGVRAQESNPIARTLTWDLMSARKLVTEATFGGIALCWESYSAASDFFEGGEWFVALYEDARDMVDIAAVSRMPAHGTAAFSTFAGLTPEFA